MAIEAVVIASGQVAIGAGTTLVYTAPANTKVVIKQLTISKNAADDFSVLLDDIVVADEVSGMITVSFENQDIANNVRGSVQNHVVEATKTIKLTKVGANAVADYYISGLKLT